MEVRQRHKDYSKYLEHLLWKIGKGPNWIYSAVFNPDESVNVFTVATVVIVIIIIIIIIIFPMYNLQKKD